MGNDKMTFAAAGDIFINRRLPERAYAGFEKLSALIGSAEVRFANLETTIHNREGYCDRDYCNQCPEQAGCEEVRRL